MSDPLRLPSPANARGRILVVGGGVAGVSAAVEAAETGCSVVLVEREAYIGGRVAQMHQYFPKLCPPMCGLELNLRRLRDNRLLQCLTQAQVLDVTERDGEFDVIVRQQPRFVTEQCSCCKMCESVCPEVRMNPFNFGLDQTKAIYLPHTTAYPPRYVIDPACCTREACARCASACPQGAIDLTMAPCDYRFQVQAVIWATGWAPYDPKRLTELGFGIHPDVITNVMMERMASLNGPTGGRIVCPSNGLAPKRVAFVQCAGSRDESHLEYCSGVCCLASAKQALYVRDACPDADVTLFYIDRRAAGNLERFLARVQAQVRFVPGKIARIGFDTGVPVVVYEDVDANRLRAASVDLVVLATGMVPVRSDEGASSTLMRDAQGFLLAEQAAGAQFPAGCARQPMNVSSSVRDATSAVARALAHCCKRSSSASQDSVNISLRAQE